MREDLLWNTEAPSAKPALCMAVKVLGGGYSDACKWLRIKITPVLWPLWKNPQSPKILVFTLIGQSTRKRLFDRIFCAERTLSPNLPTASDAKQKGTFRYQLKSVFMPDFIVPSSFLTSEHPLAFSAFRHVECSLLPFVSYNIASSLGFQGLEVILMISNQSFHGWPGKRWKIKSECCRAHEM